MNMRAGVAVEKGKNGPIEVEATPSAKYGYWVFRVTVTGHSGGSCPTIPVYRDH